MNQLFKFRNFWFVCIALTFASCNKTEPANVETQSTTTQTEEAIQPSQTQKISIVGMKFTPNVIEAKSGDTLIFTNNDIVAHNVTQLPGKKWASPLLQPGESWTFVPTQSDSLFCSIHPTMKGYINLQ